mgnify:CR=1 FL=1
MDNLNLLKLSLFIIPVLIFSILLLTANGDYKKDKDSPWFIMILVYITSLVIPLILAVISSIYYDLNKTLSVLTIIILIVLQLFTSLTDLNRRIFDYLAATTIIFPIIMIIIMAPSIVSSFNQKDYTYNEIDIRQIENSFSKIESSFKGIDKIIETETFNINELIAKTKKQIEDKNQELVNLNEQQNKLKTQLEYYKRLTSINEEQAQALLVALNRNKFLEYIVGFGIGLLSSIAASYVYSILKKSKTATNNV